MASGCFDGGVIEGMGAGEVESEGEGAGVVK